MKRRRFRKSTVILLGFTLYSVAVYAYFIPRTDMGSRHIWATMALNAVILVALWYLYLFTGGVKNWRINKNMI